MDKTWLFGVPGVLIIVLGMYVGGGSDVTCTRAGVPAAEAPEAAAPAPTVSSCRVRTTRWLGRRVLYERTYLRVTGVDSIAVSSSSSRGNSSAWFLQLMSDEHEIERVSANRDKVSAAVEQFATWKAAGAERSIVLDLSDWPFAYAAMAFGAVWLALVRMIARGQAQARRARMAGV